MPRLREFRYDAWAWWAANEASSSVIAIDTETTGLGFHDQPFCATVTWRGRAGLSSAYFALENATSDPDYRMMDAEVVYCPERIEALREVMGRCETWVFHNGKFDAQKLLLAGVIEPHDFEYHVIEDTQTIWHLVDENDRKALKHLARRHLGESTDEDAVLRAVRRKLGLRKDQGYHPIPRRYIIPYALKDTEHTLRLWELGTQKLERLGDPDLQALYRREIELTKVLLRMEANGLGLDIPYLTVTEAEYSGRVMEGWLKITDLTGRSDLNPQSPMQLKEAFAERGITLESTAVDVLRGLDDELAEAILQFRSDSKIHKTYLTGLLNEQRDGIVHPWFNSVGPRTGRMSSGSASN